MARTRTGKRDEVSLTMGPIVGPPLMVLAGMAVVIFIGRTYAQIARRRRLRQALDDDVQTEFSRSNIVLAKLKQHLLYAPLFGKRHSREFRPLARIHAGSLPLRLEAVVISAYIILNIVFCVATVDWSGDFYATIRRLRRTAGNLAALNLLPLFLTAGRNNPLIPLLGISFDTFNLFHRWIGRIAVAEGVVHAVSVTASIVRESKWVLCLWGGKSDVGRGTLLTQRIHADGWQAFADHLRPGGRLLFGLIVSLEFFT